MDAGAPSEAELPANGGEGVFAGEVARVKASGVLGEGGRLAELFDFLAARGAGAAPASQAEIAETVFGQADTEGDDATVRVYVHRLRKRLEDYYGQGGGEDPIARLVIPSGIYALRLVDAPPETGGFDPPPRGSRLRLLAVLLALAIALAAGFYAGRELPGGRAATVNPVWEPFLASDRPIMVVVGDYYIFGEIDPFRPENGRLIREFDINSKTDLARAQESDPDRYETTEDMGLNYLPFSSAYGLAELMPILGQHPRPVSVMPASQVTSDTFRTYNVVYVGLVSGMGLLEDVNFMNSSFMVGESYDELIDRESEASYVSEEALSLASAKYYRDYGYLSVFHEPGGALVAVVAGERDTGLRGIAPVIAAGSLPDDLERVADGGARDGYEALFEVTGQQGADLSEKLVTVRARR